MRKMKKINGYLVVKFNDRELREWDGSGLGSYGVIDAELYTGDLGIDRAAMEYDDADSLEVAIEQARGLESELDTDEPPATYTIVKETDDSTKEETVNAQLMIAGWETTLKQQIKSGHYPDVNPRTAAHELYGYKVAFRDLGLIGEDDCFVHPATFGLVFENSIPVTSEELLAFVCDELCGAREQLEQEYGLEDDERQERLDEICEGCKLEQIAAAAEKHREELRSNADRKLQLAGIRLRDADSENEFREYENQVWGILRGLVISELFTEEDAGRHRALVSEIRKEKAELFTAFKKPSGYFVPWPDSRERETFEHLPPNKQGRTAQQVYDLGCRLSVECPQNDCHVYLNIFNMCREMDEQVDRLEGWPKRVLEMELLKKYHELETMFLFNYAIRQYKRECKHDGTGAV